MLVGRRGNLAHDIGHAGHCIDDLIHGFTGAFDQRRPHINTAHGILNQTLDLSCRLRATLGQITDFTGYHREPASLLACARRFYRRIQRQDIGLESNTVDYADNIGDFLRTGGDIAHCLYDVIHHFAAFLRCFRGAQCQVTGLTGVFGVLFHGGGQLFHTGGSLFQRRCLLLSTGREIVVAHRNLAGAAIDRIRAVTYIANGTHQFTLHMTQVFSQLPHFVGAFHVDTLHQIAAGDMTNAFNQTIHRGDKRQFDAEPDGDNDHQNGNQHTDQYPHRLVVGTIVILNSNIVQTIVLLHIGHVLLLKSVLIALSRLIKKLVNLTRAKKLNKLRQRAVVDIIGSFDLKESRFTLTWIAR
ncbi:Uncharacterised protein [Salmonella enterica subsp. enterica serovar Bovismorbificans]|uniref:Uncharacterized protein n=1 Tax=Salmonella enterica subsp. enterica serovar Bovismorbificans TaxID=58097 RepID=A0A655D9F7_SALET|nr:Uncharacterised protein [Salmonella enterica subsp. enterica serovar Bovismorbificans]